MIDDEVFKDHRVAELYGVKNLAVLTDQDILLQKGRSLAARLKLTIMEEFVYPFEPREGEEAGGITLIFAVGESHLAIHTWEEQRYAHIDAFSCSKDTNMRNFRREVMAEFPADRVKTKKIRY